MELVNALRKLKKSMKQLPMPSLIILPIFPNFFSKNRIFLFSRFTHESSMSSIYLFCSIFASSSFSQNISQMNVLFTCLEQRSRALLDTLTDAQNVTDDWAGISRRHMRRFYMLHTL